MSTRCPSLEAALATWAAQKRACYITVASIPSVLGRIRTQRVAAGEGTPQMRQRWGEVFTNDGYAVQQIVVRLPEPPRMVLSYHWILKRPWHVPIREQCEDLGISRSEYWRQLDRAELAVSVGLELLDKGTKPAQKSRQFVGTLQVAEI